ncbi:hypothetical protein Asi02nite_31220 [Asanoa siamensis]|uniref:Uncharacterized protein n=2 Tax=Asanoa siamensis TaxID=926357 RepID=A0ABQ4CQP8_9ACTN|nr:hypothetical protein Asi02nite_31220 [Asanoa siamensis]
MTQVYAGVPAATLDLLRRVGTPMLALAGAREPKTVHRALTEITSRAPHATARLVPRMHHVWTAEDPHLFRRVLLHWLTTREPAPGLLPPGRIARHDR